MSENFMAATQTGVASGADKTIITIFNPAATPTTRAQIYEFLLGSVATPADVVVKYKIQRLTALGTEGSGFTPNNLDPAGPAGQCDAGIGTFTVEPTYTANKELMIPSVHQKSTFRWIAAQGRELKLPATQNNGIGIKSSSVSSGTPAIEATVFFTE